MELPISKSFPASSELDAAFEELQIECRTETALEKRRRITIDERIERWTLFGYTLVVAAAGELKSSSDYNFDSKIDF